MCGCVNHTRFYGGDRIRRFKLGSLVLPRCVRLRCDEGRCVVRIDVLHSLHRLSIAQWLLIEKIGCFVSLFSSLVIVIVIYVVGFLCGPHGRWVIPFTGWFIGIMFPTYMCLLMQIFGAESSRISSIVIFLSGATNGLVQLLIGSINECIGNEWGFRCNVIYTLIPFILLCFVRLQGRKWRGNERREK